MIGRQLELFPEHSRIPQALSLEDNWNEMMKKNDAEKKRKEIEFGIQEWVKNHKNSFEGTDELSKVHAFLDEAGAHKFDPFTGEKYTTIERIRSYKHDLNKPDLKF